MAQKGTTFDMTITSIYVNISANLLMYTYAVQLSLVYTNFENFYDCTLLSFTIDI